MRQVNRGRLAAAGHMGTHPIYSERFILSLFLAGRNIGAKLVVASGRVPEKKSSICIRPSAQPCRCGWPL
jgi:hypothetical protein